MKLAAMNVVRVNKENLKLRALIPHGPTPMDRTALSASGNVVELDYAAGCERRERFWYGQPRLQPTAEPGFQLFNATADFA